MLQPGPIAATAQVISEFAAEARHRGAVSVRVIATSAAREARNAEALLSAIQEVSGLTCRVIPGALEAEWAFRGVISNPRFSQKHLLILDVGGGSTEIIIAEGSTPKHLWSVDAGAVRRTVVSISARNASSSDSRRDGTCGQSSMDWLSWALVLVCDAAAGVDAESGSSVRLAEELSVACGLLLRPPSRLANSAFLRASMSRLMARASLNFRSLFDQDRGCF